MCYNLQLTDKYTTMNFNFLFQFLSELRENNTKTWFDLNRDRYKTIKEELESFTKEWIIELAKIDPSIGSLDAKKCGFRINRDVRFSNNKDPYKTNLGIFLNQGGKSAWSAGYYLHLEPNKCFFAAGNHQPETEQLLKIRQEIDYNFADFKKIIEEKTFVDNFKSLNKENALKKSPKTYTEDNPAIEYLKLKSFIVETKISDRNILNPLFINDLMKLSKSAKPLISFLNQAIV